MSKKLLFSALLLVVLLVLAGCIGDKDSESVDLKDLKVDGQTVTSFASDVKTYFVELPAGTIQVPQVTATPVSMKAQVKTLIASHLPGITTVQVVGSTGRIKTYVVCFTVEDASTVQVDDITLHRDPITIPVGEEEIDLTRGMACKIIAEAFDYQYNDTVNPFSDLSEEHEYYEFILACAEAKKVQGFEDGTFQPDLFLTRAGFATLLARCLEYDLPQNLPTISDVDPGTWPYNPVTLVLDAGLMQLDVDGAFKPDKTHATNIEGIIIPIISPVDASIKQVCFSSSNEEVALVNQLGQLTGRAAGSTTITVTSLDGTILETCTVEVVN